MSYFQIEWHQVFTPYVALIFIVLVLSIALCTKIGNFIQKMSKKCYFAPLVNQFDQSFDDTIQPFTVKLLFEHCALHFSKSQKTHVFSTFGHYPLHRYFLLLYWELRLYVPEPIDLHAGHECFDTSDDTISDLISRCIILPRSGFFFSVGWTRRDSFEFGTTTREI